MQLKVTTSNLSIEGLTISDLRVIKNALQCLSSEAGTSQAYEAHRAEYMADQIPNVVYAADRYLCKNCRANFWSDEIKKLMCGPTNNKVQLDCCPNCESHNIELLEKYKPLGK